MKSRLQNPFAALVAAFAVLLPGAGARAQSGPPFPPPNQRNPFPKVHHDAQNTGRAPEEPYWGVTDGNRSFGDIPNARSFGADGWVFPREAADPNNPGSFPLRPSQEILNEDTVRTDRPAAGFTARTAPGTGYRDGNYEVADVRSRDGRSFGPAGQPRFVWRPTVPGNPGPTPPAQMTRYRIYVWLPAHDPDTTDATPEVRITDARYRVFYATRNVQTGALEAREAELFVDQDVSASGWYPLQVRGDDGTFSNGPFFPFYPGASPGGQVMRVEMDNTTDDAIADNQVVVADALQLRQQFDVARSTPVVTNRHGGRTLETTGEPPDATADYTAAAFTAESTPGADPSLVSTLFQAPESYVFGYSATRTQALYRNTDNSARPLFSQMQVLVPRTDFITDPRDATGTGTIEVGAVYALDWVTGAPLWRFPDYSYRPGGPRNPTFSIGGGRFAPLIPGIETIDRNGNGVIENDEVFIVGQSLVGWRNPDTAPLRGNTVGGGMSGSVTFAPRVPVYGTLRERRVTGTPTNNDVVETFPDISYGTNSFKALGYVGSNNGVLYALDAYGNNDGLYTPSTDVNVFGAFVNGSTNVLWTFDPAARSSITVEDGSGVGDPPGVWTPFNTYRRAPAQDRNAPNPATFTWTATVPERGLYAIYVNIPAPPTGEGRIPDARYFVDGVECAAVSQTTGATRRLVEAATGRNYFALDPATAVQITVDNTTAGAFAGRFVVADSVTLEPFGGGVPRPAAFGASSPTLAYEQASPASPDTDEQRLFIGNENGVLYAMNASANPYGSGATGPSPALPFSKYPAWWFQAAGGIVSAPAVSARAHSNSTVGDPARRGVYFTSLEGRLYCVDWQGPVTKGDHVTNLPAYSGSTASAAAFNDAVHVRPRWTFPNRYVDIDGVDNASTDPPDTAPGTTLPLAAANNLGPIFSAPSLMDFPEDPSNLAGAVRSYVVLAANDDDTSSSPGHVYLLDPAGDRRSFLTNPTTIGSVVAAHPLDRYAPGGRLGSATPAWTHRFQYGTTTGLDPLNPLDLLTINSTTTDPTRATPARRSRPTVYLGGIGRLYAVDIDPATNLFVRWPTGNPFPGPDLPSTFPPDDDDALDPPNPALPTTQQPRPIIARLIDLSETSSVDGLAITGGPLQVRGSVPNPTYSANLLAVNQDIRDPETQGTTTFQYPVLYVTTTGGYLYEVSTNTEGEDVASPTGSSDTQSALGWALSTDTLIANPEHVLVDAVQGPGGPSGPAVMSNVVFEGLDPFTGADTAPTPPFHPRTRQTGDTHTGQVGFPLDHNGLYSDPAATTGTRDRQGTLEIPDADTTPAQNTNVRLGNRIVWVFSGGPDGVIYGFTPGAFGGGGGSSPGGRRRIIPQLFSTGDPKVDIFDREDFFDYQREARDGGDATRPNRDGRANQSNSAAADARLSRAAKGKNNFFEWGETVYIIAWDVNGRPGTPTPGQNEYYAEGNSVIVTITDRRTGAVVARRELAPETETYPFKRDYMVPPRDPPAGVTPVPLGVAFLQFTLDAPSATSPQTPGSFLEVRVEQRIRVREAGPGGGGTIIRDATIPLTTGQGANTAVALNRLLPLMAIANPLGIAASLRDMENVVANPSVAGGASNPLGGGANAIGPFPTLPYRDTTPTDGVPDGGNDDNAKKDVVPSVATPNLANDGSTDPDRSVARYNQAITNGNIVERYDYRPYTNAPLSAGGTPARNPAFKTRLTNDPRFYLPIAASAGFVGHGSPGSTSGNLLLLNRSRLVALNRVRAARADMLWRWWPGRVPNADVGPTNLRTTPTGMSEMGLVNPLPPPFETAPGFEAQPWKPAGIDPVTGTLTVNTNVSEDYPDIPRNVIGVTGSGGDLGSGRATLPAPFRISGTNVEIKVPRYQPANLVAVGNLTSTYVAPNGEDFGTGAPLAVAAQGPLQVPRGITSRQLSGSNPQAQLTPFGYTTRLFVYVDANGDNQLNLAQVTVAGSAGSAQTSSGVDYRNQDVQTTGNGTYEEAYREFEVWMGVPVDLKLKAVESIVDLGSLPHGFGIQNGLLGYGQGALPYQIGFLPPPLSPAYTQFVRSITIQNVGNTNLWNLRANQRFMDVVGGNLVPRSLTLRSDLVNPAFGIASFGADPNLNDPLVGANAMTQIVTPLDVNFDTTWASVGGFGGRHPLHKPRPGAINPTVLGLPDTPAAFPAGGTKPFVGVAVPLGTPVGTYTTPLAVFESHDTAPAYQPVPRLLSGLPNIQIAPAGPLYGGRNDLHPGDPSQGTPRAILPAGTESFLRPRRQLNTGTDANAYEYLPYTDPSLVLKVSVQESPLTGQTPDLGGSTPPNIVTGALPNVDLLPLLDAANGDRPASALTPAAFRSATNGSLHVYLTRNATDAGDNGTADALPGRPYRLFRTSLLWDTNNRVFTANKRGAILTDYTDLSKMGRWFTKPALVSVAGDDANRSSNTSPFVLHDVARNPNTGAVTGEAATLFWLNTLAPDAPGGVPIQTIYYAPVSDLSTGDLGAPTPFLDPSAGNPRNRPDPSLRRFAPKAVSARDPLTGANLNTIFLFYYGGVGGRWQILYAPFRAENGAPSGYAGREQALSLPGTLSSASDPDAVFRTAPNLFPLNAGDGQSNPTIPVVDLYYTGISRANQNTDVYMTRYRVLGSGANARLAPQLLTPVASERLQAPDRDPIWHGKHIGWYRLLNNRALLPVVYVQRAGTATAEALQGDGDPATPVTDAEKIATRNAWQYDEATGLLFQTFERLVGGVRRRNIVYVDSSAGTVRFRGLDTPTGSDIVYADYTPETYRITRDSAADLGASTFMDRTILPATTAQNGYANTVVRRPAAMPVDRQWVVWQKGAQPGRASTLYYNTRRVGVDLKAIPVARGGMAQNESMLLQPRGQDTNQQIAITSFTVAGQSVPADVDFKNGRVYVPSLYEGLPYQITYKVFRPGGSQDGEQRQTPNDASFRLNWIEEAASGQMISMQRSVNEGQPTAFLDLFNGVQGTNDPRFLDPTLQPGRVWLFWTSPRGRTYDIYWQTIAPYFESPSFSGLPQP